MFNALNKLLVYITVGAVMALIGMGWMLNITIDQKATLAANAAIQEHTISILQEDAVDMEYTILTNQFKQDEITDDLEEKQNELQGLKLKNPHSCFNEHIPSSILERLHKNSNKSGVRVPSSELVIPYED